MNKIYFKYIFFVILLIINSFYAYSAEPKSGVKICGIDYPCNVGTDNVCPDTYMGSSYYCSTRDPNCCGNSKVDGGEQCDTNGVCFDSSNDCDSNCQKVPCGTDSANYCGSGADSNKVYYDDKGCSTVTNACYSIFTLVENCGTNINADDTDDGPSNNDDITLQYLTAGTCSGTSKGCNTATGACYNTVNSGLDSCSGNILTEYYANGVYCLTIQNDCNVDTVDADATSDICTLTDGRCSSNKCITPTISVNCDATYDDKIYSTTDMTIADAEVTASSCTSTCTGSNCCSITTKICDDNSADNFYVDANGCGGSFNIEGNTYYCYYSNGYYISTSATKPTEDTDAACGDGKDNDCNGLSDCADYSCAGKKKGTGSTSICCQAYTDCPADINADDTDDGATNDDPIILQSLTAGTCTGGTDNACSSTTHTCGSSTPTGGPDSCSVDTLTEYYFSGVYCPTISLDCNVDTIDADATSDICTLTDGRCSSNKCITSTSSVNCDATYDDKIYSTTDMTIADAEVTASSCTSTCTGSDCCSITTKICDDNSADNFYVDANGCGGSFNIEGNTYYCYYSNGYYISTSATKPTEDTDAACGDGKDNDCDGTFDANQGANSDSGCCVYTSSSETCDNLDNNCNGQTDEECDSDNDEYADATMTCSGSFKDGNGVLQQCATKSGDCNDAFNTIHPNNPEDTINACTDNIDNDCDSDESNTLDTSSSTGVDQKDLDCCAIENVYWEDANGNTIPNNGNVFEDNNVKLVAVAKTGHNCNGKNANYVLYEDNLVGDTPITLGPDQDTFASDASLTWNAVWMDGNPFPLFTGNPTYYFKAKTDDMDSYTSPSNLITVLKSISSGCLQTGCPLEYNCMQTSSETWECVGLSCLSSCNLPSDCCEGWSCGGEGNCIAPPSNCVNPINECPGVCEVDAGSCVGDCIDIPGDMCPTSFNTGEPCLTPDYCFGVFDASGFCIKDIPPNCLNLDQLCIDENGICELGESCLCNDCQEQQDSCTEGNICIGNSCGCDTTGGNGCTLDPTCKSQDPDCCEITDAYWSESCTGNGKDVTLAAIANEFCSQSYGINFDVYEKGGLFTGDTLISSLQGVYEITNEAYITTWTAENTETGDKNYIFKASINENSFDSTNKLIVKPCDLLLDEDCDQIFNEADICWNTPSCTDVNGEGCTSGQTSCIAEWDCTAAVWSECDQETNLMTRDVELCKFSGDPDSPCAKDKDLFKPPATRECVKEEEFPFFTKASLIVALTIIIAYYLFWKISRNSKKRKLK